MKMKKNNRQPRYLSPKQVILILKQQELKVSSLASLMKKIPWIKEEFDTDSTVPNEKFSTPITILTGGDFSKPTYHFLDNQKDNKGVLPATILSVLKTHLKAEYIVEFSENGADLQLLSKLKAKKVGLNGKKFKLSEKALEKLY